MMTEYLNFFFKFPRGLRVYMRDSDAKTTPPADAFLDPDEVVAEDGKETNETFFWKVCVLCEAHMRRSETFGKGR